MPKRIAPYVRVTLYAGWYNKELLEAARKKAAADAALASGDQLSDFAGALASRKMVMCLMAERVLGLPECD